MHPGPVSALAARNGALFLLVASMAVAWFALTGASAAVDTHILQALRSPENPAIGIGPPGAGRVFWLVSLLGTYVWLAAAALTGVGVLLVTGRRRLALAFFCAVASAFVAALLLKLAAGRPRPDIVPHLGGFAGASFPSSHAMLSLAVYGMLAIAIGRITMSNGLRWLMYAVAVALAAVIGFSRLYLGVHWPTDVMAGWFIGGAWALGFFWIAAGSPDRRRNHARSG